jgi:hypothetical protein
MLLGAAGCHTPDIAPFVDATVQLRSAIAASGSSVESELRLMSDGADYADQLHSKWPVRVGAADALVSYASSLKGIVDAGEKGSASAQSLADSLKALSGAAGIAVPPAGAATVAADAASFVYGHIARVQAAKSLKEALVNAQPAIERIAACLIEDFKDMHGILLAANTDIRQKLQTDHNVEFGFRNSLLVEQNHLYAKGIASLSTEEKAKLLELGRLLESTNAWHGPLEKAMETSEQRLHAGLQVLTGAESAIREWAYTHEQLTLAVKDNRTVDTKYIATSAGELRDLIKRMREL